MWIYTEVVIRVSVYIEQRARLRPLAAHAGPKATAAARPAAYVGRAVWRPNRSQDVAARPAATVAPHMRRAVWRPWP